MNVLCCLASVALLLSLTEAAADESVADLPLGHPFDDHLSSSNEWLPNSIDLDQKRMVDFLDLADEASFERARNIYEKGGHASSVATITLVSPLESSLPVASPVVGQTANGNPVHGKLRQKYGVGHTVIEMEYDLNGDITNALQNGCYVGGLGFAANTKGCLVEAGTLSIIHNNNNNSTLAYTYNANKMTRNRYTLRKLSTTAENLMHRCDNCPYQTYRLFHDYYGEVDYGDRFIEALFDKSRTWLTRGNTNFSRFGFLGRAEAIELATVVLNVWMYIIREMESAVDKCRDRCLEPGCNDDAMWHWNDAVALYTGSQMGALKINNDRNEAYLASLASDEHFADFSGGFDFHQGIMLYSLSHKMCQYFNTCETSSSSNNNYEQLDRFNIGAAMLKLGQCSMARDYKEQIEHKMAVPLIQGTLRSAYILSVEKYPDEMIEAQGVIYAASILPLVHSCDKDAATTIYNTMHSEASNSTKRNDFEDVQRAFGSVYECLGISSSEVGGLWDEVSGDYYPGASPLVPMEKSSSQNLNKIIGFIAAGLLVIAVVAWIAIKQRSIRHTSDVPAPDNTKEISSIETKESTV